MARRQSIEYHGSVLLIWRVREVHVELRTAIYGRPAEGSWRGVHGGPPTSALF